jgi:hypothetical protein
MTPMTEEEKENAAAYMKLQDDVRQLIVNTVYQELNNFGGVLQNQIKVATLLSYEFEQKVKDVIKNQMVK